jgi:branched-chain amino acid transport system ATP-binding protein
MLTVRNLNVWYGPTEVLRDVSFEVPQGKVIALMGGNGAGKTTVLRALSGLVKPRAGEATFGDRRIDGLHPADVVTNGLVQVPQGRFVWPRMTVGDNLLLGAVTRPREEYAETLRHVHELFPVLKAKAEMRAGQLSGGEQQMVAIGRAMMARPRMLMMDEPSAGLAPKVVNEMADAIRKLHETGLGILLVEQNVGVAGALADTAFILANGEIAFSIEGSRLASDPQVIRSYLGR